MNFVRSISGYNHLWAVRDEAKDADELTMLFRQWSNANYLLDFFLANLDDLQGFFHVQKISDAIKDTMEDAKSLERLILDFPYTEQLDSLFHPLSLADNRVRELTREKARNWDRERHASWLRIYAIRIEPNVYIGYWWCHKTHSDNARKRACSNRIEQTQCVSKLFAAEWYL